MSPTYGELVEQLNRAHAKTRQLEGQLDFMSERDVRHQDEIAKLHQKNEALKDNIASAEQTVRAMRESEKDLKQERRELQEDLELARAQLKGSAEDVSHWKAEARKYAPADIKEHYEAIDRLDDEIYSLGVEGTGNHEFWDVI